MIAYASGSGGVLYVPEEIERTIPRVKIRKSNDNKMNKKPEEKDK
ncbi:MAG: hypothetical protein OEY94_10245 [Alphaproteobacteria bacterium]|nr:hypothetical protein [Alphaproteobacteria bacterium]